MSGNATTPADAFNAEVQANITDTSSGILVGTDPAPAPAASPEPAPEPQAPASAEGKFTQEDLARARQQEKDKLYPQLETLKETVARLEKEREEREQAEQAALLEAEELARKQAESQTDVRDLLTQKEQEWQQRLEEERAARENAFALLEREREFQALAEYRQNAIASAQDRIMPELLDLVTGNTPEEIDASLNSLEERSARILESARSATQTARREMSGPRVTAPPTGPMDTHQEQQQFTPESIREMSIEEYAKNRGRLLGANPHNRGMFG